MTVIFVDQAKGRREGFSDLDDSDKLSKVRDIQERALCIVVSRFQNIDAVAELAIGRGWS